MPEVPEEAHQEQFGTPSRQKEAATLGVWVFLSTEILFFGPLFIAYGEYRWLYPVAFHAAGSHLMHWLGYLLTLVLATSSWTASGAVRAARRGRSVATLLWLGASVALGAIFMTVHLIEWSIHIGEGAGPGEFYHFQKVTMPGASVFFTLYFLLTGLHMFHVTVGLGLLTWAMLKVVKGEISADYSTPVETISLYWHFVDIIWSMLFPVFYLIT